MLKLKLQYFGHLMWRVDSLEKTLMLEGFRAGEEGNDRGWDGWMASPTQWTWVWVNSGSWWWTGRPGMLRFMGSQRVGHDSVTELNWTELNWGHIHNMLVWYGVWAFPYHREECRKLLGLGNGWFKFALMKSLWGSITYCKGQMKQKEQLVLTLVLSS